MFDESVLDQTYPVPFEGFQLKAIRRKCLDCCCGSSHEVDLCQAFECPLWSFRFGKAPNTVRKRTPERLDPREVHRRAIASACREDGREVPEWALTGSERSSTTHQADSRPENEENDPCDDQ